MGRAKKKDRRARGPVLARVLDATPERLAKSAGDSEWVNPAEIDSSEQTISRTRRFRDSWIDRLYRSGRLTHAQWFACCWYRDLHAAAFTAQRVVADYGQGAGGAGSGNYGQAFNEAQHQKRKLYRHARGHIPSGMLAFVEALVLRDEMPAFANGQQRRRFSDRIAAAVQPLAAHIVAPGWWITKAVDA